MIDGVLYVKVVDPKLASYGVENAMCAPWTGERPRALVDKPLSTDSLRRAGMRWCSWRRRPCAASWVRPLAARAPRAPLLARCSRGAGAGPGKITLDKTFEERDALNHSIVKSIQCAPPARAGAGARRLRRGRVTRAPARREAANAWGLQCMRYEIRDITGARPPHRPAHASVARPRAYWLH